MSWKRNVFGCLMWVIYLFIVGTAMIFTGCLISDSIGMAEYFGIAVAAGYLLFAGILVFGLHRMAVKLEVSSRSAGKGLQWLEGLAVLALFAAGLFLRVRCLQSESYTVPEDSIYLEPAYISGDGQGIPPFAHGAVYLYLWALRLCFMLLGNKAVAAVWFQIGLQMLGVWLLYFAIRKMTGKIPAVMMLSFFMLSPYMVDKALVLSPEMLYLLGFSFVVLWISLGVGAVFGWGVWLVTGALGAILCYLDVSGFLLLPLMLGVIFMRRQEIERKIIRGLVGCMAGFVLGAGACIMADMISSGKSFFRIIGAWAELYRWEELQLSVTISSFSTLWMVTLLLCFMVWGIYSFWCVRGMERFSMWILGLGIAAALQSLGMFTEEMNGFCYIFFFSTVLAGLGIRESTAVCPAESPEEMTAKADEPQVGKEQDKPRTVKSQTDEEQDQPGTAEPQTDGEQNKLGMAEPQTDGEQDQPGMDKPQTDEEQNQPGAVEPQTDEKQKQPGTVEPQAGEEQDQPEQDDNTQVTDKEKGIVEERDRAKKIDKADEKAAETAAGKEAANTEEKPEKKREVKFIENPLPLPKKHEKRVMDYKLNSDKDLGGYDVFVADDDDFDH